MGKHKNTIPHYTDGTYAELKKRNGYSMTKDARIKAFLEHAAEKPTEPEPVEPVGPVVDLGGSGE